MPLDPVISRGVSSIGRDLPQVAQLLDSRDRWNQLQAYQQKQDAAQGARQATADARETTQFNQEQQVMNTKLLAAASAEIAQNPAAAQRWIPQLKQAGIIRADFDLASMSPEQLQSAAAELYKSTSTALAAMNPAPPEKLPTSYQEYQLGAEDPGYAASLEARERSKAPVTTVNVDTGKKFGETFAAKQADQYSSLYDQAQKAPELINRAKRVRELLKTGAYTGAGAEFKLAFGKAAKTAGLDYGGTDVANTEALAIDLAAGTLDMIKASGLGGGTGFSNADRDFLEKVVGGKITLDRATIARTSAINERAGNLTIKRWNETAQRIGTANPGLLEQLGISPSVSPPQGGTQELGPVRVATPDEAMSLPSGTQFVTPDGRIKVRP